MSTWFDCAPTNGVLPPTVEELAEWMARLRTDSELRQAVWHRYVVARGGTRKFSNWLQRAWFFRNATKQDIAEVVALIVLPR